MRLASFNVENLFTRPKAMAPTAGDAAVRKEVLAAHARVSQLFDLADYSGVEPEILSLLDTLGLLRTDEGEFARLRKLRGDFLKRPRNGPPEVVANGRGSWIGWVELKHVAVDERATWNTARTIHELDAQVMTVIEADNRPGLSMFSAAMLQRVGGRPYEQVMVVEGNDTRGIDVGLLAREEYPLRQIRTHVFDRDEQGVVFSRDCCEYHLDTPAGERLVVVANHFKSKGYSTRGDPNGGKKRTRQAARVAQIVTDLLAEGVQYVAVTGDLNDDPTSSSLAPLLSAGTLTDVSAHPDFAWCGRRGTYRGGNEKDKIDYLLLSEAMMGRLTGGGVFRKGVWRGPRTREPWEIFDTLEAPEQEASDHAAIWADLDL